MKIFIFILALCLPVAAQLTDDEIAILVEQMVANEAKMEAKVKEAKKETLEARREQGDAQQEATETKLALFSVQAQVNLLALHDAQETERANLSEAKTAAVTKKYHRALNFFGWIAAVLGGWIAFNLLNTLIFYYRIAATVAGAAIGYATVWMFF